MNGTTHARTITIALTAIACVAVIAGCGSGRPAGTTSASAEEALTYVRCLRAHGVPDFPDPSPGGRLPNISSSINTVSPAFQAAQRTCAVLAPGAGGPGSGTGSFTAPLLAVARCMRAHGLPNFPDPTTSPPPAPPPGADPGNAIGGPGAYLQFPPPSPALTHAEAACGTGIR